MHSMTVAMATGILRSFAFHQMFSGGSCHLGVFSVVHRDSCHRSRLHLLSYLRYVRVDFESRITFNQLACDVLIHATKGVRTTLLEYSTRVLEYSTSLLNLNKKPYPFHVVIRHMTYQRFTLQAEVKKNSLEYSRMSSTELYKGLENCTRTVQCTRTVRYFEGYEFRMFTILYYSSVERMSGTKDLSHDSCVRFSAAVVVPTNSTHGVSFSFGRSLDRDGTSWMLKTAAGAENILQVQRGVNDSIFICGESPKHS